MPLLHGRIHWYWVKQVDFSTTGTLAAHGKSLVCTQQGLDSRESATRRDVEFTTFVDNLEVHYFPTMAVKEKVGGEKGASLHTSIWFIIVQVLNL
jgi:hypothetical protein